MLVNKKAVREFLLAEGKARGFRRVSAEAYQVADRILASALRDRLHRQPSHGVTIDLEGYGQ
jgi:hypothetical protein